MRQFLRFVTVGMTNTAVTLGAYSVALRMAVPYLPAGALAYGLGAAGYALGLGLSLASDLPPGPLIVCVMTALGVALFLIFRPQAPT